MSGEQTPGVAATEQGDAGSALARIMSPILAVIAQLLLLDAAVETFWGGSPLRWWIAPAVVAFLALSVWLWRPGGVLARGGGWTMAAATSVSGLLLLFVATAWLPAGQSDGVRMLAQPTSAPLTVVTALAVVLAVFALVRAFSVLPATPRLAMRVVVLALAAYAVIALALGVRDHTPYAALFHGGALWQRLPSWLQGPSVGGFVLLPLAVLASVVRAIRKSGRPGAAIWRVWAPIALLLVFAIAISGYAGAPALGPAANATTVNAVAAAEQLRTTVLSEPGAQPLTRAVTGERLQYLLGQFASLERDLPKDTFDPQAVVDAAGRDPGSLFAWVRDRTFSVPYRGALRGPVGVLMDRVGSSLDRSLLLAELLRLAGRGARLAHADLTPDQVRTLLGGVKRVPPFSERIPQIPPAFLGRPDQVLSEYAQRFQKEPAALVQAAARLRQAREADTADARRTAAEHARLLLAALGEPKGSRSEADAATALADHWWVQYDRDGQWIDCDPALPGAAEGQTTAPAQTTSAPGELPEENYWTVNVRVVIERWSQGQLAEETVLDQRLRTLDILLQDITLAHAPLNFPRNFHVSAADPAERLRSAVLDVHEWVPTLIVGGQRTGRASIRDDGTVNEQPGQKPQGGAGGLFGSLAGGDEASSAGSGGVLTAEWIDYEIQGPGSAAHRVRRESFDLVGPAARARGALPAPSLNEAQRLERGLTLLGQTAILVQVAQPSQQFLAHRLLARFGENRDQILALAGPTPLSAGDARALIARLVPRSDPLWAYAAARFENSAVGGDVFLDAPAIATLRSTTAVSPEQRVMGRDVFDIVSNQVGVREPSGRRSFSVRVEQGVADTIAETAILKPSADAGNTADVFGAAAAQQIAPIVVRSPGDGWTGPSAVPADVLTRIRADLSDRHDVVLPARSVTMGGMPRIGWWRVSIDDGTVVGVMDTGLHQGMVERAVKEYLVPSIIGAIVLDWLDEHLPSNSRILSALSDLCLYLGNALKNQAAREADREGNR